MIEFILDILFNNPEGLTFALFGLKKKRKKAEKLIRQIEEQGIPELDSLKSGEETGNIPQFDNSIFRTPITPTSPGATSYKPEFPYRGKQIIIDSDRVLINSKADSTFIVGKKAVGISTQGTFNVDSGGKTIINSPEIYLGLEAKHPFIKGDLLLVILTAFIKVVDEQVCEELKAATDSNNVEIATVVRAGETLKKAIRALANRLPGSLSELVKTQ